MKLAFVVQRYGADIAGGSEAHCRAIAEHLSRAHDITVLTTCARDYVSWGNELPPGVSREHGITVHRFPVRHRRRLKAFADISDEVLGGGAPLERQQAWFRENGPEVPALLDHLRVQGDAYDLVLFWTFRYAPSFFGVPVVADRAVLLPTAEDDAAVRLDVLQEYFQRPAGFLFLTPEEQGLVERRAGRALDPSAVIGVGLEPAPPAPGRDSLDARGIPQDYVLYLGRVDRNKGCDTLLEYYQAYAADTTAVPLVLAGPAKMMMPDHPAILPLGYVSDAMREALLAHARALIVPSPYESLSMVLLEAWNHGVPALVNGWCQVLEGQVRRADGGLPYRSAREFTESLRFIASHPREREALGRQGLAYVEREYRWPTVTARIERLLEAVRARRSIA